MTSQLPGLGNSVIYTFFCPMSIFGLFGSSALPFCSIARKSTKEKKKKPLPVQELSKAEPTEPTAHNVHGERGTSHFWPAIGSLEGPGSLGAGWRAGGESSGRPSGHDGWAFFLPTDAIDAIMVTADKREQKERSGSKKRKKERERERDSKAVRRKK